MSLLPRRSLLSVLVFTAALSLSACASPTAPQSTEEAVQRRQDLVCLGSSNGTLVVLDPVNGSCPAGFDLQPWW